MEPTNMPLHLILSEDSDKHPQKYKEHCAIIYLADEGENSAGVYSYVVVRRCLPGRGARLFRKCSGGHIRSC